MPGRAIFLPMKSCAFVAVKPVRVTRLIGQRHVEAVLLEDAGVLRDEGGREIRGRRITDRQLRHLAGGGAADGGADAERREKTDRFAHRLILFSCVPEDRNGWGQKRPRLRALLP
jgi:hypothetical protein